MMALTAENNRTPLQMAVRRNNIELVGTLLACQVKDGEGKALADAIEAGYTDIVHLLLLVSLLFKKIIIGVALHYYSK